MNLIPRSLNQTLKVFRGARNHGQYPGRLVMEFDHILLKPNVDLSVDMPWKLGDTDVVLNFELYKTTISKVSEKG
jgi:hypothetical protein